VTDHKDDALPARAQHDLAAARALPARAQHDLAAARFLRVIGLSSLPHARPTSLSGGRFRDVFLSRSPLFFTFAREMLSSMPINTSTGNFTQ
jgi:hypothetical protein